MGTTVLSEKLSATPSGQLDWQVPILPLLKIVLVLPPTTSLQRGIEVNILNGATWVFQLAGLGAISSLGYFQTCVISELFQKTFYFYSFFGGGQLFFFPSSLGTIHLHSISQPGHAWSKLWRTARYIADLLVLYQHKAAYRCLNIIIWLKNIDNYIRYILYHIYFDFILSVFAHIKWITIYTKILQM